MINMANTNTKTVGKTTKTMKGENKMDVLKKQQMYYNNRQTYNKTNHKYYTYMTNTNVEQLRAKLNNKQLEQLTKAWQLIEDYNTLIFKSLTKNKQLDRTYGREEIHYSELSQEEIDLIQQHRNKQQEFKSMKGGE